MPKALTDDNAARYVKEILHVRVENILLDYKEPDDLHLNYYEFERDLLTPKLKDKGYEIVRWQDGERDSFGPLSRVAIAFAPSGVRCNLVYG